MTYSIIILGQLFDVPDDAQLIIEKSAICVQANNYTAKISPPISNVSRIYLAETKTIRRRQMIRRSKQMQNLAYQILTIGALFSSSVWIVFQYH